MNIAELRPEFSVLIVDTDFRMAQSVQDTLKSAGYDAKYFPTYDSALAASRDIPPHIVVVNYENFETQAENFLDGIQAISPEIICILMISLRQVLNALQMVNKGRCYDYIVRPYISSLELVQKVDRATERLYYQFESEQTKEAYQEVLKTRVSKTQSPSVIHLPPPTYPPAEANSGSSDVPSSEAFLKLMQKLSATKEVDQTLLTFMESLSTELKNTPILYFKYLPQYMSLVVSQSVWLPIEKIRGIGIDLKAHSPEKITEFFQNPMAVPPLQALMTDVFKTEKYFVWAHQTETNQMGLFVLFDKISEGPVKDFISSYALAFDTVYRRNQVLKEKHILDKNDPLTGLSNRKHFLSQLDEEITRSRRIAMPVSMIYLNLDGFRNLNQKLGQNHADTIIKMLAAILKKTARINDILARIGADEMIMLLPHTDHMGTAVKAERIRRIVESTKFPIVDGKGLPPLTVSIGVSEYPSFCNDAEGLMKTADEALHQVKNAGGNRVCLATAPSGFQPDFPVKIQKTVEDRR